MRRFLPPTLFAICLGTASLSLPAQSPVESSPALVPGTAPASPASSPAASKPAASQIPPLTGASAAPLASPTTAPKPPSSGPSDPKAAKTYAEGLVYLKEHKDAFALDAFRKADKQDGGKCLPCELKALLAANSVRDYKVAREQAALLLDHVTSKPDKAQAHYLDGEVCLEEGTSGNHEKSFQTADTEFKAALDLDPTKSECIFGDALALAHLKQDDAARQRFQEYLKVGSPKSLSYERAQRFADHPEIARARVAPNFRLTAMDGSVLSRKPHRQGRAA